MPAKTRLKRTASRMKPDDRISEILKTTRQLLSEKGFENVTTLEIAARCRISEAGFFKYFPTKRDLLTRVAEIWFEELINQIITNDPNQTIFERLHQMIGQGLTLIKREPSLTRYILMDLRADPNYRLTYIYQINRLYTGHIISLLNEAVASGEFRKDIPVALLRNVIFGGIEHQTWAYLRGEGDFDIAQAADGITNLIYQGMAIAPVRGPRVLANSVIKGKRSQPGTVAKKLPSRSIKRS